MKNIDISLKSYGRIINKLKTFILDVCCGLKNNEVIMCVDFQKKSCALFL